MPWKIFWMPFIRMLRIPCWLRTSPKGFSCLRFFRLEEVKKIDFKSLSISTGQP